MNLTRVPGRRAALGSLSGFASLTSLAGLIALPACAVVVPQPLLSGDDQALLGKAVAGAHRTPAFRLRDVARHPFETLAFFGIRPDHTVVEIAPGGGWYTEILAPYLRERGLMVAAHYARDDGNAGRRKARADFESKLAAAPALYDRVRTGTLTAGATFKDLPLDKPADAVLTFRNVHNWIEDGTLDNRLQAFASVLRTGGVLGVEDHRAAPGTSLEDIRRSGYVTEALMIERAKAAGFELQGRSEINTNPADSKNHPHGVWSLPPTLRGGEPDRARFVAIGESDRFTHRYVKVRG